jgi:hypothetical protein
MKHIPNLNLVETQRQTFSFTGGNKTPPSQAKRRSYRLTDLPDFVKENPEVEPILLALSFFSKEASIPLAAVVAGAEMCAETVISFLVSDMGRLLVKFDKEAGTLTLITNILKDYFDWKDSYYRQRKISDVCRAINCLANIVSAIPTSFSQYKQLWALWGDFDSNCFKLWHVISAEKALFNERSLFLFHSAAYARLKAGHISGALTFYDTVLAIEMDLHRNVQTNGLFMQIFANYEQILNTLKKISHKDMCSFSSISYHLKELKELTAAPINSHTNKGNIAYDKAIQRLYLRNSETSFSVKKRGSQENTDSVDFGGLLDSLYSLHLVLEITKSTEV